MNIYLKYKNKLDIKKSKILNFVFKTFNKINYQNFYKFVKNWNIILEIMFINKMKWLKDFI